MKLNQIIRPSFNEETKNKVLEKTGGFCHLCNRKLSRKNYGNYGTRGAWEIDHSVPISKGGKNHLNNYLAACISCNRAKGNNSTHKVRQHNGLNNKPMSKQQRQEKARNKVLAGAASGALFGSRFGPFGIILGGAIGALMCASDKAAA